MNESEPVARPCAARGALLPAGDAQRGLTRGQFLVGGGLALGGLAVAGVVTQRTLPLRSYWYRWTGQCGPEGPVPADLARPTYGTFRSELLAANVEYGFSMPPVRGKPLLVKFPVCYCLPARGQGPHWVLDRPVHLADFGAQARPDGSIPFLALVAIDGSDTYWHERASGEDRMKMLLDEFIPWYEQRDVGGSRENRAVMGWSMGGYGALLAAERRPDLFGAVVAASPALWRSFDDGVGDAFDDARDFAENDVFAGIDDLRDTAVRVDCGKADIFYDAARDFAARCAEQTGRPVAGDFSKGCHDPDYWRRVAADELDFIQSALGRAAHAAVE
jgi:enterochelin esterase-like enzyme